MPEFVFPGKGLLGASKTSEYLSLVWEDVFDVRYLVDPASGICLSQGLSHASAGMSELNNETANGSVKQL